MASRGSMVTMEERVSRLEGVYEHVATKADLAEMEKRLLVEMETRDKRLLMGMENRVLQSENSLRKEMSSMVKWVAGLQLLTVGTTLAGVAVLFELLR
jgi:hypothetical protein